MSDIHTSKAVITDRPDLRAATPPQRRIAGGSRRGVTLIELIMGITVLMILMAIAVAQITRLQRAYAAVTSAMQIRARLRDGSDIVRADLRGIASAGASIISKSDTAIEFYSAIGTSTICTIPSVSTVTLPPGSVPSARVLSAWVFIPDIGDEVLILADSTPLAPPMWQSAAITDVTTIPTTIGCPAAAGLLSPADVAGPEMSYQIALTAGTSMSIHTGAPVRVIRHVRYNVYRAGDGSWYLGYRICNSGCSGVQPVSGPYTGGSQPPITFHFFRRDGTRLADGSSPADVSRIEILLRASYSQPFRLPGMATGVSSDSVIASVALRN
ncbi:MAG: prepilin-type N-terminal cleavage/methylation domain-containing protein [Gemmatimonadaceae bacterium]